MRFRCRWNYWCRLLRIPKTGKTSSLICSRALTPVMMFLPVVVCRIMLLSLQRTAYAERIPSIDGIPITISMPDEFYQPSEYDPMEPEDSDEAWDLFYHDYFLSIFIEYHWKIADKLGRWPVESAKAQVPRDSNRICLFRCRLTMQQRYRTESGTPAYHPTPNPWNKSWISMEAKNENERFVRRSVKAVRNIGGMKGNSNSKKCYRTERVSSQKTQVSRGTLVCLDSAVVSERARRVEVLARDDVDRHGSFIFAHDQDVPPDWLQLRLTSATITHERSRAQIVLPHQQVSPLQIENLDIAPGSTLQVCALSLRAPRLTMELNLWRD